MPGYDGSLLGLSVDLTNRFLPAFDTPTGIPLSWVNLRHVREGPCLPVEGSRVSIWQPAMGVVISCGIALASPPACRNRPAGKLAGLHLQLSSVQCVSPVNLLNWPGSREQG